MEIALFYAMKLENVSVTELREYSFHFHRIFQQGYLHWPLCPGRPTHILVIFLRKCLLWAKLNDSPWVIISPTGKTCIFKLVRLVVSRLTQALPYLHKYTFLSRKLVSSIMIVQDPSLYFRLNSMHARCLTLI